MPEKIHWPNMLIVSGNGRNSGKTGFITRLIGSAMAGHPIAALKISPHLHQAPLTSGIIHRTDNYIVAREENAATQKDSSRMLRAGASEVFYIEATDEYLSEAFNALHTEVSLNTAMVCESGGLASIVSPSLFIMINRDDGRTDKDSFRKRLSMADHLVIFNGRDYDPPAEKFCYNGSRWILRQQ